MVTKAYSPQKDVRELLGEREMFSTLYVIVVRRLYTCQKDEFTLCRLYLHTNGQQVHENILNVSNHQRNAKQNHNENSPHTCQDTYYRRMNAVFKKGYLPS